MQAARHDWLFFAWAALAAAAAIGLSIQSLNADDATRRAPQPEEVQRWSVSDQSDVKNLIGQPGVKVIDARGKLFFRRGHIPGALNLARSQFEIDFAANEKTLRGNDVKTLVVYCSDSSCDDSRVVAEELQKRGFPQVVVYVGGWEAWGRGGGATEKE